MASRMASTLWVLAVLIGLGAVTVNAQSFRVQCPTSTITHPDPGNVGLNNSEPPYSGPTQFTLPPPGVPFGPTGGFVTPTPGTVNGAIKCQQISGGDGFMTEADGTQTFMFAFGPLSGLADVAAGLPSTQFPNVFNTIYPGTLPLNRGEPATTDGATNGASPGTALPACPPGQVSGCPAWTYNGAIGLSDDIGDVVIITDILEGTPPRPPNNTPPPANLPVGADYCSTVPGAPGNPGTPLPAGQNLVTVYLNAPLNITVGQYLVIQNNAQQSGLGGVLTDPGFLNSPQNLSNPAGWLVTCVNKNASDPAGFNSFIITYNNPHAGLPANTGNNNAGTASVLNGIDGHVDPRQIIDTGVMNGNIPAPLAAFDEDDEFFLTLTNVGMIQRPDLFEQHTVHFHGYPNASSFYDGVPDASVAINIGASFTYYYLAPDAGTYFWHCHITPPEHLQMGMVGQLHVRPRQDRVPQGGNLYTYLQYQNGVVLAPANATTGYPGATAVDLRTVCTPGTDILCSATMPAINTGAVQGLDKLGNPQRYTYNDGDASTAYDVEYPLQMHGFDPNFHFVGMTFNPELFVDMKDKYFLLNGRSYPDTIGATGGLPLPVNPPGPQATVSTDGIMHYSQPMPAIINIPFGGKALLRLVNLSVSEYHTLQSLGVPMKEVGFMAKLLRDQSGYNTEFYTNSITLGGGESLDTILDASDAGCGSVGCAAKLYPPGSVFYLYTPQLDHLSNDAENFGGLMTEVHICNSVTGPTPAAAATFGNTCN